MMKIKLSKRAMKFLSSLPPKQARQLSTKIKSLAFDSEPVDSKQLSGYTPLRRTDAGEYRIIYQILEKTIEIPLVGKRNDGEVYKKLKRLL